MGNVFSRCVQNVRNTLLTCSKKHNEDEPMLTSTCDSEAPDKYNGPCLDPSVSLIDRDVSHAGSQASLVRCGGGDLMVKSECFLKTSTPKSFHHPGSTKGYKTLPSCDDVDDNGAAGNGRAFVDRGIQTSGLDDGTQTQTKTTSPEPQVLSKEFIIKTYSIKNATPSPTIPTKFSPSNLPRPTEDPDSPPPQSHESSNFCSYQQTPIRQTSPIHPTRLSILQTSSQAECNTPVGNLLHRQEQVLNKLEDLQSSVTKMAQKYNVSTSSTAVASSKGQSTSSKGLDSTLKDIVISVDPSNIPLSLLLLCEQLSKQYSVFKSTYVHSSVSGQVPDNLLQLFTSNGGLSRVDSQVSVILMWKKVTNGPQLVVDPTRQTPIHGEANVIRYLARLMQPAYDETDILTATQIDEFLDLAQLQLIEGNSKEKGNAVRSLNASLGKKNWLIGDQPGIADFVCWSALHQAGLTEGAPTNVKRWLGSCNGHVSFKSAVGVVC